jgi:hypothetical protein
MLATQLLMKYKSENVSNLLESATPTVGMGWGKRHQVPSTCLHEVA